jgi:putative ABC transport system ATP-binding protein
METAILRADKVSKNYGSGHIEVKAIKSISLNIKQGEIILIMGPSGSGKTTMLSMLGGLLTPTGGKVEIDGIDITSLSESRLPEIRALKIGFIFQAFNLLEALSVEENILFPARLREGGIPGARPRANKLIERLGLEHRRAALPRNLSGGEKQRVAIARALINEPRIILADEPTGNLDSKSGQEVLMILHDIARDDGCSVVIVTHDPRVEEIADRILWLDDGELHDRKAEEHSWVRDPVCGMKVDEWTATIFSEYKGKRYAFCSERCKERFDMNPGDYIEVSPHEEMR